MTEIQEVPWTPHKFYTEAWVSPAAQAHWQPIIQKCSVFWNDFELTSVLYGLRKYAMPFVRPEHLAEKSRWATNHDLVLTPVSFEDGSHRCILAKSQRDADYFFKYWKEGEDWTDMVGEMLGYPKCCVNFFHQEWDINRHRDLNAWMKWEPIQQASCNIMLRDLGIRAVFHLPCSITCVQTAKIAQDFYNLAVNKDHLEMQRIHSILRWPVKYTSLHGIAEITTPVVKFRRDSDVFPSILERHFDGDTYPAHGASGLSFPFWNQLVKPMNFIKDDWADNWSDNGFPSQSMQNRAHQFIATIVRELVDRTRPISMVDLGCGNGELLRRLKEVCPNIVPYGFDSSSVKVEKARIKLPGGIFTVADVSMVEFPQNYDIGLVARQRIEEAERSENEHFLPKLKQHFKKVVMYDYSTLKARIYDFENSQNISPEASELLRALAEQEGRRTPSSPDTKNPLSPGGYVGSRDADDGDGWRSDR